MRMQLARLSDPFALLVSFASLVLGACAEAPVPSAPPAVDESIVRLEEPPVPVDLADFGERVVLRVKACLDRVRENPDEARAWAELGQVLEVRGLRELAVTCYEQARLRDPAEARWSYRASVCRWRLGQTEAALADIDRAVALAPDYASSYYRRGTLHLERGDLDAAFADFREAARLDPDAAAGPVGMARVHLQRDQATEAADLLEPLYARDPNDPILHGVLSAAYTQSGAQRELPEPDRTAERESSLWVDPWEAELEEYRDAPEIRHVTRLLEDGRAEEATRLLEARRGENPGEDEYQWLLAEAYFLAGRAEDARRVYGEVLERTPENIPARMAMARFHEQEGDSKAALPWLDQVLEIDPDYGRAWEIKGRILYYDGQYGAAVGALNRAVELDQRNPELWLWLGASQLAVRLWPDAEASLKAYLEREPESGRGHLFLARAHVKQSDAEATRRELALAREYGTGMPGMEAQLEQAVERLARAAQRAERRARRESDQ